MFDAGLSATRWQPNRTFNLEFTRDLQAVDDILVHESCLASQDCEQIVLDLSAFYELADDAGPFATATSRPLV